MTAPCSRCKQWPAEPGSPLCSECVEHWQDGRLVKQLPEGHPFTRARQARLARMAERARRCQPVCERVVVDLS